MQELAIFAVRLLSNKNMHLGRGEGGSAVIWPCPRRHESLQWIGRDIPRHREADNLGP